MKPGRGQGALAALICAAVLLAAPLLIAPAPVAAQEACSLYTVKRGDTLRVIHRRAYRNDRFRSTFEANRPILPSPDALEVGQILRLPCRDGTLPPGADDAALIAMQPKPEPEPGAEVPAEAAPAPEVAAPEMPEAAAPAAVEEPALPPLPAALPRTDAEFRLVTAGEVPPFAEPDRPGEGLVTELLARLLGGAEPPVPYRTYLVRDREAVLETLLPLGTFDLAFPFWQPDCAALSRAPLAVRRLCADYAFSRPILEARAVLVARAGTPLAFAAGLPVEPGGRACVATGYFGPDPVADGLLMPGTETEAAAVETCLTRLAGGDVTLVLLNEDQLGGRITAGMAVLAVPSRPYGLVLVAPKARAEALARLAEFDRALAPVLEDPEFAGIARDQIAAWRAVLPR